MLRYKTYLSMTYVCPKISPKFKTHRYQIWTAVLPWKCMGLYVRYIIVSGIRTAIFALNVDLKQMKSWKDAQFSFLLFYYVYCLFLKVELLFFIFIYEVVICLLTIEQTQLYTMLTVFCFCFFFLIPLL